MLKSQLDHMVTEILHRYPDMSDVILTVGKPVQVEVNGRLQDVRLNPDPGPLVPFQTEALAMAMMGTNLRLYRDQVRSG